MTRAFDTAAQTHGIALGVFVGALNVVFSRPLGLDILISVTLTIAAGWPGSKLGS